MGRPACDPDASRNQRGQNGHKARHQLDVLDSTTGNDISGERLFDGTATTLSLIAPVDRQEQLKTVFATLVAQLCSTAYARGAARPLDPPALWLLDELVNVAPLHDLDKLAATVRGQGGQLLSIVQDLGQLEVLE